MPVGIYKLWQNEENPSLQSRGGAPAYLPAEHRVRWEKLRQAKLLFEGKHRQYFLDEERTEFHYPESDVNGRRIKPYKMFNLLKLVSVKTADLLFGAKARLTAPTTAQSDRLDTLARQSLLHSRFHSAVVAASWAGGAFLESMLWRGEPYMSVPPPEELFPIGRLMPNGQYERYVRYATETVGTAESPILLMLESEYRPGSIVRRLWQVEKSGEKSEIKLDQWPAFKENAPAPEEKLGIPDNAITYLPNEVGGVVELSDYDGLISLQDTVNAKFTQVARVLAQHADPKLAMPEQAANAEGNVAASHNLFYFRSKEEIPQYIVWSAELEAALADRVAAINALCIQAEMSQVLLGIKEGAAPDAARKLRLEATNSLAKIGRKALIIEPAIARAVETTQRLDQTSSFRRSYPVEPIGVEARDGLPVDEIDEANAIQMYRAAGVMSVEAGVERRIEDPDGQAIELRRLSSERAAATPSVLMSEPGETEPSETPEAA